MFVTINILKFFRDNIFMILYCYFFLYAVWSVPMILVKYLEYNSFNYDAIVINILTTIIWCACVYISYSVVSFISNLNSKSESFLVLIQRIINQSLFKKMHIPVFVFGLLFFIHNKTEQYISEKLIVGEAIVIDSKKLCDWHLYWLCEKFSRTSRIQGEISNEKGKGFEDLPYVKKSDIRSGKYKSDYVVSYKPIYADDSDYGTEDYGKLGDLQIQFWKIHDGLFIEGDGDNFHKF